MIGIALVAGIELQSACRFHPRTNGHVGMHNDDIKVGPQAPLRTPFHRVSTPFQQSKIVGFSMQTWSSLFSTYSIRVTKRCPVPSETGAICQRLGERAR